jgi:hypothetical protein
MQYFRPGSQLRQLITMLSIVGEYPIRSLYLLGNERAYKALVHKLTTPETFRIPQTETEMTTRLLTVTGKGNSRSVRFYKGALPILDWLHPDAYRYYMDAFWEHKFPGNAAHRDRNHRVAEAVAMCMRSGIECRPYMLPILQNRTITKRIPDAPCFYLAKELKKLGATVKDISLPNMQHAIPAYYVIAPAEASSNLSRFDGVRFGYRCENPVNLEDLYKRSRGEGFGEEVKRRIMVGTYALSAGYYDAYYIKAQQIRRLIKNDFVSAFAEVDVILGPTTPNPAISIDQVAGSGTAVTPATV